MIDFNTYEQVELQDVAEYARAQKNKIYPGGSSTLQISASRGQIGFLNAPGLVPAKDVVIIPSAGINMRYFNFILEKNIDKFMNKYATGINIKEDEVGHFPIELHNTETQKAIVKMLEFVANEEDQIKQEIETLKKLKQKALREMFV